MANVKTLTDPPVKEEKKQINYIATLMNDGDNTLVYQGSRNYGLEPHFETFDEFASLTKERGYDLTEDELKQNYDYFSAEFDRYENRNFDLYSFKGNYDEGGGTVAERGLLKWFDKDESFVTAGPTNYANYIGVGDVKLEHEDQIAEKNGVYKNRLGVLLPLAEYDKTLDRNQLVNEWDKDQNTFIYRELKEGESGTPGSVRPETYLGNGRTLNSTYLGSLLRGGVGGGYAKTVGGVAGMLHFVNAIGSIPLHFNSGMTYAEYSQSTGLNKFANELSNHSSANSRQNYDEAVGAFTNMNAFLWGFGDGVMQLAPMIASGYALGAIGVGAKVATQLSISIGSFTVYESTRNDLLAKGYSPEAAETTALLYGAMTHASENIIGSNLIQGLGVRAGVKAFRGQALSTTAGALESTGVKAFKGATKKSMSITETGLFGRAWMKKTRDFISRTGDLSDKNMASRMIKGALAAGGEEGVEELFEGIGQAGIARVFNSLSRSMAQNTIRKQKGIHYDEASPDGLHNVIGADNIIVEKITSQEKMRREKELSHANAVLNGSVKLDEGVNPEEAAMAFITAGATMGIGGSISKAHKARNMDLYKLGEMVADNPQKLDAIAKNIDDLIKGGAVPAGKNNETKQVFLEEVMLYADGIKRFGLTNPEVIKAAGGDKAMLLELYESKDRTEKLNVLKELIAAKDKDLIDDIKEESESLGFESTPTEEMLNDELKKESDLQNSITTTKDKNDEVTMANGIKGTTSLRYTQKVNELEAMDVLINKAAFTNLKTKYGAENIPEGKLAEEIQRIKDTKSPDLINILKDNGLSPIWDMINHVVTNSAPAGEKIIIDRNNRKVESHKEDFKDLAVDIAALEGIKNKTFAVDAEIEEVEGPKDADGKTTKVEKEVNKAKTGMSMIETVVELAKRKQDFINSYVESNPEFRNSIKEYNRLVKKVFANSEAINYSKEASTILRSAAAEHGQYAKDLTNTIVDNSFDKETGATNLLMDIETVDSETDQKINNVSNMKEGAGGFFEDENLNPEIAAKHLVENIPNSPDGLTNKNKSDDSESWYEKILTSLKDGGVRPEFVAFIEGIMNDNILSLGSSKVTLSGLVQELNQLLSNPTTPVEDGDEVLLMTDAIKMLLENMDMVGELLYDMTVMSLEKSPKTQEHSIFNHNNNGRFRFNETEKQLYDELISSLKQQNTLWAKDDRLKSASRDRRIMKGKIGNQTEMVQFMRNVIMDIENFKGVSLKLPFNKLIEASDRISNLISSFLKDNGVDVDETLEYSPEQLYNIYHNATYDDKGVSTQRMTIEYIITQIDKELFEMEKMLSGKLNPLLKAIKESRKGNTNLIIGETTVPYYNESSDKYDGSKSLKNLNDGRELWEDYMKWQKETTGGGSILTYLNEKGISGKADIIHEYEYGYYKFLSRANTLGQNNTPTRTEILRVMNEITNASIGSASELETHEQLDVIVDVIAFLNSDNKDWYSASSVNSIKNTLFVRGFPGSGKTEMIAVTSIVAQALLNGKKTTKVGYVLLTKGLRDIHEKNVIKANKILEKLKAPGKIKAEFIETHLLKQKRKLIKKQDFIIYEEGSTISEPHSDDKSSSGPILKDIQKKYGKKVIILGDEGQVRNLDNYVTTVPVEMFGEKTAVLSQVFRTNLLYIRVLSERFKDAMTSFDGKINYPKTKFKHDPKGGLVGVQYVDKGSDTESFNEIISSFKRAVKFAEDKETTQMLLVPTYKNKVELIESDSELKELQDHIYTLEYDAKKILESKNNEYYDYNASGLSASQVFMPFSYDTMINGVDFPLSDLGNKNPEEYALAILLTAASRASQYVEMIGDKDNSVKLSDDAVISGYGKEETTDEEDTSTLDVMKKKRIMYFDEVGARIVNKEESEDEIIEDDETEDEELPVNDLTDQYDVESEMYFDESENSYNEKTAIKLHNTIVKRFTHKNTETATNASTISSKHISNKGNKGFQHNKSRGDIFRAVFESIYGSSKTKRTKADKLADKLIAAYREDKYRAGYKRRMVGLAENVGAQMNFKKNRKLQVTRPEFFNEKANIVGHPFGVKTIGYVNGKPIVDIYVLNYTANDYGVSKEREALGHMYRLLAESNGMKVNSTKVINVVDGGSWTEINNSELGVSSIIQENKNKISLQEVSDDIGIKPEKTITREELFSKQRSIAVWYPNNTTEFAIGDSVVIDGHVHYIEKLLLDNNGLKAKLSNLKTPITGEDLISNEKKNRTSEKFVGRSSTAKEYVENEKSRNISLIVPTTSLFKKVTDIFKGKWSFNRDNNKWLKNKFNVLDFVNKLSETDPGGNTFEVQLMSGNFSSIDIKGNEVIHNYNNAVVTVMSDEQIENVLNSSSSGIKMTAKEFKKNGYHIISVEAPAEFTRVNEDPDKYTDNWISNHPEYKKLLKMSFSKAKERINEIVTEGFAYENDDTIKENLINMNVAKFMNIHKLVKDKNITRKANIIVENAMKSQVRNGKKITFNSLKETLRESGFKPVNELTADSMMKASLIKKGTQTYIEIAFSNDYGDTVDVRFDTTRIQSQAKGTTDLSEISGFIDNLISEIKLNKKFDVMSQRLNELWEADEMETKEAKD